MRIRFLEKEGQREFLDLVVERLRAPSLRGVLQFGFDVPYSTLKNYYSGVRLMPKDLIVEMCEVAGIDFGELKIEEIEENWGRVKGGRIGKRSVVQ